MRRNPCSSRAFFGNPTNGQSEDDEDVAASNSRSEEPDSGDEEEEEDEDDGQESDDEYKDKYVQQIFRKEYKQLLKVCAQGPVGGRTARAAPSSDIGARSTGRNRRTISYKEREVEDIPYQSIPAFEVCCQSTFAFYKS
ncbi:hypothetical protein K458DRAFT_161692 [Lentithecium fluviatile CBS 122367]|uniref:Uncharacterized protein n=1 Tax=Lentithecium fluviatile CBS 122367 TaxID=1168545 RepID=A0A6G1IGJ0_9PLEO|nr:hypothetical protein K458DRAFT_161692 [Lentithecium fluviatile CBS 122367]